VHGNEKDRKVIWEKQEKKVKYDRDKGREGMG
jgi:hypothetical protein